MKSYASKSDLGMYCGANSIYQAMRSYASMVFPSSTKFASTSDSVSETLLSVMMGLPMSPGFELRIFNKFLACNLLYQQLTCKNVSMEDARKLSLNDRSIYGTCGIKALPPHIEPALTEADYWDGDETDKIQY